MLLHSVIVEKQVNCEMKKTNLEENPGIKNNYCTEAVV